MWNEMYVNQYKNELKSSKDISVNFHIRDINQEMSNDGFFK